MRSSMAYFAGAGTVVVAVVAGVGGGLLFANMVSPKTPKMEQTHLERRMSAEPIQASKGPPEPVPYLAAAQPGTPGVAAAVVPAQAQSQQAPPQTETASSASASPVQPAETSAATQKTDTSVATQKEVATTPTPPAKPVAHEATAVSDDAMAKARDGDLKRAAEKRKTERRQQWTERRRRQPRQELGQDQELREVEQKVREETEPRRELVGDPVRIEMPRIRLFGPE
jgi:hypothetical protein